MDGSITKVIAEQYARGKRNGTDPSFSEMDEQSESFTSDL